MDNLVERILIAGCLVSSGSGLCSLLYAKHSIWFTVVALTFSLFIAAVLLKTKTARQRPKYAGR